MGTISTIPDRVEAAASGTGTITFVTGAPDSAAYSTETIAWSRLHEEARAMAAALQSRGAGPGITIGILGPTSRALITAIQATWLSGATLAMLPLPMRLGSIEEFVDATRRRIASADASIVLIDPQLADFVPADLAVTRLDELRGSAARFVAPVIEPDSLAILQFTSGSTSEPKGVMLPHRCVTANLDAIRTGAAFSAEDRVASWLPLYHDMGLIGLLGVPMTTGADLVIAGPQDFLAAPVRWLDWMSSFGCTTTGGPNFAYALAARAARRAGDLSLDRWRLALNGAEPIDPDSVESFLGACAPFGLHAGAAFCVYGMAEATLAISFPTPGTGMTVDAVDRRVLETDRYAAPITPDRDGARRIPRLGRVLDGLELRIVDPETGALRHDREVGEIELRGASITPGYYRNPEATAAAFDGGGWLQTGDLGYLVDDEVVVCGRRKDVIIVGGRNVFPEDIERAAARVEGVRAGNVIAFGTAGRKGREAIVVVAESKAEKPDPVRSAVAERVTDAIGIPPTEIVLVAPGTLPKTSSGKLQRSLCRDRYLDSALS